MIKTCTGCLEATTDATGKRRSKARVKRRSSHAPNLGAALSSTQERRLT